MSAAVSGSFNLLEREGLPRQAVAVGVKSQEAVGVGVETQEAVEVGVKTQEAVGVGVKTPETPASAGHPVPEAHRVTALPATPPLPHVLQEHGSSASCGVTALPHVLQEHLKARAVHVSTPMPQLVSAASHVPGIPVMHL